MGEFYTNLEAAYTNLTAWRSWSHSSVIWKMLHWETSPPARPLFDLRHLQLKGGESMGPEESIQYLDKAAAALHSALRIKTPPEVRSRIEEDSRSFRYGDESFRFFWAMAQLYQAELDKDSVAARRAWQDVERYAASLVSYYAPFQFAYPGMGVSSKDALERTQLRPLFDRLREKYGKLE